MTHQPIAAGQTLTARSLCDYDCIFEVAVVARKGNFATIIQDKQQKRVKVRTDFHGDEYLMPERYSMAPMFRAPKLAVPVFTVVK